MGRHAKERPSFPGGFLKLQRRHFDHFATMGMLPEESYCYIQLLAAARWDTRYVGTLGNADEEHGPISEWSTRDIALCCGLPESTARRYLRHFQRLGLVRRCCIPSLPKDSKRRVWQVEGYSEALADDK